jgi:hypothetical protein
MSMTLTRTLLVLLSISNLQMAVLCLPRFWADFCDDITAATKAAYFPAGLAFVKLLDKLSDLGTPPLIL